jgi:NNP family nitrate/nitrite transporter-like MFS transporter
MPTLDPLRRHLTLGTLSFGICFAAWGLISAFAVRFRERFELSGTETALLVAVPVLLGSLARLPMGILADRFGARKVFSILMAAVSIPVFLVPQAGTYQALLVTAFFLGLAGSSFSVGVSYVSRWSPPAKQGGVLGVYGMGNIGQSAAVFLGPLLAAAIGWELVFTGLAGALFIWAVIFWMFARDAPAKGAPKGIGDMVALLMRERLAWVLSAFYFLTFGGFVAFAIYLPTLLKDDFGLTPADAGFRAAGFVILATLLRPVGGALADKIGGARVLNAVFIGVIPFALLLSWNSMIPFTVGALGCAALLGLGNGAVFKLVPQYFPNETGAVTGLVGAMGGLGGFFPPLLLGFFRDQTGVVWPGFVLLAATSFGLFVLNRRVLLPKQEALELNLTPAQQQIADQLRAGGWATMAAALLVASIVVGSRNLQNFDAALVIYTFASVFAAWGVVFHYAVWLQKPPTRIFFRRGFQLGLQSRASAQPASPRRCDLNSPPRPDLHPASLDPAMVDAPVPLLGLPARGRDHLPPRLRLDPLRHLARRSVHVRHLRLRFPDRILPGAHGIRLAALSMGSTSRPSWCWPASPCLSAGGCATTAR